MFLAPVHELTSSPLTMASPPRALISSTTACAGVVSAPEPSTPAPRSFTTTLAPCLARPRACSRPTPRAAPVTSATLPSHKRAIYYLQKYIFSFIFRLDLEKQVQEHHPLNNR